MRQHIPALDGVRGLAIILVITWHSLAHQLDTSIPLSRWVFIIANLGCFGVNLFFVLSGFLITRILLDTRSKPRYFTNFYARRALRIFPLYYLYLLIIVFTDETVRANFWWFATYCANFWFAKLGYFATPAKHTWSLCVEEQFYLLWPMIVWALRGRFLLPVTCLLVLLSWTISLLDGANDDFRTYILLQYRMDALLLGALLAMAHERLQGQWGAWRRTGVAGAVITGLVWTSYKLAGGVEASFLYGVFGGILADLFFTFLLVAVLASRRCSSFFEGRIIRSVGKYSYCMYLFHVAVISCMGMIGITCCTSGCAFMPLEWVGRVIAAQVLTYLVAFASWHLYEKHFLNLKQRFEDRASVKQHDVLRTEVTQGQA